MIVFLASQTYSGFHGLSLGLLVAAGIATACFALLFAWRWLATRPRMPGAGPESSGLGPEPPGVVNLLVNGWHITGAAVQATLVDLAARKVVAIDLYGQDNFVVRLRQMPEKESLSAYEHQMLDLVRKRASGGSVPAEALDLGEEAEAQAWRKRFNKAIVDDARSRKLARTRWAHTDWVILGSGFAAVCGFFALAFAAAHVGATDKPGKSSLDTSDWLGIGVFAWALGMAALSRLRDLRDTPAGRDACTRWLGVRAYLRNSHAFDNVPAAAAVIWERYLAYGVSMGIARDAAHNLPLKADDPDTAWSRYSGTWREIRVEYPRHFGFGGWPLGVFAGGLARTVFWGAIGFVLLPIVATIAWDFADKGLGDEQANLLALVAVFVAGFAAVGLYVLVQFVDGLIRLFLGGSDLLSRALTVEGEIVKNHLGRIAVDDGHAEEIRAWPPPPASPHLSLGEHVRATMSPRLCHVASVEIIPATATAGPAAQGFGGSAV